ncbi:MULTISPECIES: hypothetical protein [Pseudomonas]|uniref:DUF2975 domain-containing protein n=1 Tax=Pseudomonas piscis TaxID=2614538 RepID=U6ZN43_9PSED|nr:MULTISPECIES: hypothetical protein [Pseudomonas]AZC15657.1 hypothetical protein C4K40_0233 [Pseudomonas sp. CMR5c]ERO60597.1 hypothetical protein P308_01160 [Pseudomonas piscis]MCU7648482.1 hypothetical protein [Pseudomonas piscis]MQA56077.1 hypothetical protein [Pseudomonas piscis]POA56450.1 hypothetical protein C1889_10240 [Pseudomonas sp. FW507-12TSA]
MPLQNNGSAQYRLRRVGMLAAILAWVMGIVEIGGNAGLWIYSKDQVLGALLGVFAEHWPRLLEADFKPSTLSFTLLVILDFLPLLLSSFALWLTGVFFMRLSRGETWSDRNIRILWRVGMLWIIAPATFPMMETLQGLALSIDLPPGERILQISAGFSSYAAYEVVKGILLCSFSIIMRDAKILSDEHSHYI